MELIKKISLAKKILNQVRQKQHTIKHIKSYILGTKVKNALSINTR